MKWILQAVISGRLDHRSKEWFKPGLLALKRSVAPGPSSHRCCSHCLGLEHSPAIRKSLRGLCLFIDGCLHDVQDAFYVNHVNTLQKSWKICSRDGWSHLEELSEGGRAQIYLVCSGFELAEALPLFFFFPDHCSCGEIARGMPGIIRLWSDNQKRNSFGS